MYVLVLKHDRSVSLIGLFQRHPVGEWIGVDLPAASLVHALFKKHRIRVGYLGRVSGNDNLLLPAADGFDFSRFYHQAGPQGL